jgi:hypothetical protein
MITVRTIITEENENGQSSEVSCRPRSFGAPDFVQPLSEHGSSISFQIGKTGERGNSPRKTRGRVPPPGMPWWWNNL